MPDHTVTVNRAPVLTLWAAVVAERLGYDHDAALTLGKAVAGLNAQSKGRSLGIFGSPKAVERGGQPKRRGLGEDCWVEVCGRPVPVKETEAGLRAVVGEDPIDPAKVAKYLESKFGDALPPVCAALEALAGSLTPEALADEAYGLYERFRPAIPAGKKGWGQAGELDLDLIRALAAKAR